MLKKGQISVEYLIIAGFVVFLVISILGIALIYSSSIEDRIKINQIERFADNVISNSEKVFFQGEPSRITITAHLPKGVENIQIISNELVFDVLLSSGSVRTSFTSSVPMEGSFSVDEGTKRFTIVASSTDVVITEG